MLSPENLFNGKCFILLPYLNTEECKLDYCKLEYKEVDILDVTRIGDTYFIRTAYGVVDMSSMMMQVTEQNAKVICDIYNKKQEEKGGVQNEQEETSDQG